MTRNDFIKEVVSFLQLAIEHRNGVDPVTWARFEAFKDTAEHAISYGIANGIILEGDDVFNLLKNMSSSELEDDTSYDEFSNLIHGFIDNVFTLSINP